MDHLCSKAKEIKICIEPNFNAGVSPLTSFFYITMTPWYSPDLGWLIGLSFIHNVWSNYVWLLLYFNPGALKGIFVYPWCLFGSICYLFSSDVRGHVGFGWMSSAVQESKWFPVDWAVGLFSGRFLVVSLSSVDRLSSRVSLAFVGKFVWLLYWRIYSHCWYLDRSLLVILELVEGRILSLFAVFTTLLCAIYTVWRSTLATILGPTQPKLSRQKLRKP